MNYIVEVEDSKTDMDMLDAITEALNAFGISCYVYEETKEKKDEIFSSKSRGRQEI